MDVQNKYSYIRGFNFQPPWGSNGRDIWLNFDPLEYRRLIVCAKKVFPKINTLRIWLSFDAWLDNDSLYLENIKKAGMIIAEEGLKAIPVYFNGWRSIPDFGGFIMETLGMIKDNDWVPYRTYLSETCQVLEKTGCILMHDISNEPFNNVGGNASGYELVSDFLEAMSGELREHSMLPITVGSQGYILEIPVRGCRSDMELMSGYIDVVTLHPYSICFCPLEAHRDYLRRILDEAQSVGKPVIVTESCWDGKTDEDRGKIVDTELKNYADAGVGFLVHALSPSGVADLHEKDAKNPLGYMVFMMLDGNIRPYHECFNKY